MYSLISEVTPISSDVNTGAILGTVLVYSLVAYVLAVIPIWAIFTKAGEAGWQALIPIWSTIILLRIAGKPWWWILLFWVPILNIVLIILWYHGLSLSFGHGGGFTVGLIFLGLIFLYVLAFDSSRYLGPGGYGTTQVGYATA